MKKQLLIIGIAVLLVCVGLSGCTQQSSVGNSNNQYSNLVEISGINTSTVWYIGYQTEPDGQADGFYHDYPKEKVNSVWFRVNGTVKNIATKPIDRITIYIDYLDDKGNILTSRFCYVNNLYLNESQSFYDAVNNKYGEGSTYFDHISDYKYRVTEVSLHQ